MHGARPAGMLLLRVGWDPFEKPAAPTWPWDKSSKMLNVARRGRATQCGHSFTHSLVKMDVVCLNRRCATEQIPMLPLLYRQPIVRHGAMQPIENISLGHQCTTWIGQHLRNRWRDAPSCADRPTVGAVVAAPRGENKKPRGCFAALTVSNSSKSIVPLWSSSKTRIRFHRSCDPTQYAPLHRARQVTTCTRLFIQPDAEALEALSEYKKTVRWPNALPSSFWVGHGAPSEVLEQ